jgi:Family of unknown function (DUF6516)
MNLASPLQPAQPQRHSDKDCVYRLNSIWLSADDNTVRGITPTMRTVDIGLETLLDFDGIVFGLNKGFWVKFDAHLVTPNEHIPHGLSYSFTLHDRNNIRIMGFDNAHGSPNLRRKKYGGRKITWDHKHRREEVIPYEYESAEQLITDFWEEVNRITPS